jgi:hypothetical protein
MSVDGALVNAGTVSVGGATAVIFSGGTDRLILDPGPTFTGTVVGGSANTAPELAQVRVSDPSTHLARPFSTSVR